MLVKKYAIKIPPNLRQHTCCLHAARLRGFLRHKTATWTQKHGYMARRYAHGQTTALQRHLSSREEKTLLEDGCFELHREANWSHIRSNLLHLMDAVCIYILFALLPLFLEDLSLVFFPDMICDGVWQLRSSSLSLNYKASGRWEENL